MPSKEQKPVPENIATASMQFRLNPDTVPWLYAVLGNQPQVDLYNGEFPEPFRSLTYVAAQRQEQLLLVANLGLEPGFTEQHGSTIGAPEVLAPLLKRYPRHEFSGDGQQLTVFQEDGQVQGVIVRVDDRVVIQRGGQAGQLILGDNPINSLPLYFERFSLLAQRYISAIWNASPETNKKNLQLTLDIPQLPEGALKTYFSTFEIIGGRFRERPRLVDLDEDIGGYAPIKALMKSLVMDLMHPDSSRRFGTQPFSNKLVLICGDEGTGKSLFPKALGKRLRAECGDQFEHYRLRLADMLTQYGPHTATLVKTVLDHIRENEKKGIPTLLHVDNLDHLIPPHQRVRSVNGSQVFISPSGPELAYSMQTLTPLVTELRNFGVELGGNSHYVIVYGESRAPREELPEEVARTFRRSFSLGRPGVADLADILRVQIGITRGFAERTGKNPFAEGIEEHVEKISQAAVGLVGNDIKQAILNIATRGKAAWDGESDVVITSEDLISELNSLSLGKGVVAKSRGEIGFLAALSRR